MAAQDEIAEAVRRFQAELDRTAPKIAETLGIAEDGQLGLIVPDAAGQLELMPAPAPIDPRTIEQRAADAAREIGA